MFSTYFELGLDHITDWQAYDHMLFLVALCSIYSWGDIRKVAWLVTAFTVGHSVTLALSALDIVKIHPPIIEFLIPLTILLTALYHTFKEDRGDPQDQRVNYGVALLFGLIHGMGFSNYFKALLGASSEILWPLLAFNIGVEIGQLIIVAVILTIASLVIHVGGATKRSWTLWVCGAASAVALLLMTEVELWP